MTAPKGAEPNELTAKLRELGNYFWRYRNNIESALCHSAAGEIERLAALVEMERKAAEDRLELVNRLEKANAQQAADYALLAARVSELEGAEPAETELLERDLVSMARLLGRAKAVERPWQPIESAPRDGTRVELWGLGHRGWKAFYAWHNGHKWLDDHDEPVMGMRLTHWRREPAGPSASPPLPSG